MFNIIIKDIDKNEKIFAKGISEEELRNFLATLNKLSDNMVAQTQSLSKTDDSLEL